MAPHIKKRLMRTAVLSFVALLIGGLIAFLQIQMQSARTVSQGSTPATSPIAGLNLGGPFTLTAHTGESVSESDYEGQYKLIYFGFTYCPAICPTELQKISRVMKGLEKNKPEAAETIAPLFITVDPERDNVEVMREYVSLFHPRLVGLTGTQPQIDVVKKSYRVFATKVDDKNSDDYTVDHSSFIYFIGPDDSVQGMYRVSDTADEIYADIASKLK